MLIHKYVKTLRQVEQLKDEIFRQRQEFERQIHLQLVHITDLRDEYQTELESKDVAYRTALRKIHEEAFHAGALSERNAMRSKPELMLRISPCIQLVQQAGWMRVKRSCEFCLHYQVMLRGTPWLEPHVQLLESQVVVDAKHEWDILLKKAREMTEAVIQGNLDGAGVGYLVELSESIVINKLSAERTLLESISLESSNTARAALDETLPQLP